MAHFKPFENFHLRARGCYKGFRRDLVVERRRGGGVLTQIQSSKKVTNLYPQLVKWVVTWSYAQYKTASWNVLLSGIVNEFASKIQGVQTQLFSELVCACYFTYVKSTCLCQADSILNILDIVIKRKAHDMPLVLSLWSTQQKVRLGSHLYDLLKSCHLIVKHTEVELNIFQQKHNWTPNWLKVNWKQNLEGEMEMKLIRINLYNP